MRRVSAQVWSMDLIIGVIVFLLAVGLLLFFSGGQAEKDTARLKVESRLIADKLTSTDSGSIVSQGSIDEQKLVTLVRQGNTNYLGLKEDLGVKDDFCVLLVDEDDNMILIADGLNNHVGFGSDRLNFTLTQYGTTVECGGVY